MSLCHWDCSWRVSFKAVFCDKSLLTGVWVMWLREASGAITRKVWCGAKGTKVWNRHISWQAERLVKVVAAVPLRFALQRLSLELFCLAAWEGLCDVRALSASCFTDTWFGASLGHCCATLLWYPLARHPCLTLLQL